MGRILSLPRNIDAIPPGGIEFFRPLYSFVPNDGAAHELKLAGLATTMVSLPNYRLRLAWLRVEWTTIDLTIPPPLTFSLFANGQPAVAPQALAQISLVPTAPGTPAFEAPFYAEVAPNAQISAFVTNAGAFSQSVGLYLTGWAYAMTQPDGVRDAS